jgi:hypothetical protein
MSAAASLSSQLIDNVVNLDDLKISFHRTVRVPDNQASSDLPPDLGRFPIFQVKNYVDRLPPEMAAKGGLFFPMYRKSTYINFLEA